MSIVNELDLSTIHLDHGSHSAKKPGEWCVMEAVSWAAGEPWTDRPSCVSPVIASYCITLNDRLNDEARQKLVPYIFKVIGTNTGEADDEQRRRIAATHFARLLPGWLDAAGLPDAADRIRALGVMTTRDQWKAARSELRAVGDLAWNRRWAVREPLRQKVAEAVRAKLAEQGKPANANVADAAADAVADAVAANANVAAAAAAAANVAAAAADADAAAVAVTAAVAVADFRIGSDDYWKVRDAVYKAVRPIYERAIAESPVLSELVEQTRNVGFDLLDEMCAVGR